MESSIAPLQKSITHFFGRFHFMIFIVSIAAGLALAIFFLNSAIASSDPSSTIAPNSTITFDQATIDRLNKLQEPGQPTENLTPNGRVSPF